MRQEKRFFDRRDTMMERSAQRRADAQKKLAEELTALERENYRNRIQLDENSKQKSLDLIKADYDDRIAAIKKKGRELAKANREAGVKGLDSSGLTSEQSNVLAEAEEVANKQREKSTNELYKAEAESMRNFLSEYGTFQQQKLAIAEEYAEKIRKAQTEGEKLTLAKQRDAAVRKVEFEALKADIDWKGLFSGVGSLVEDQIKPTLDNLRGITQGDDFKNYSLEEQEQIFTWISELEKRIGGGLSESFKKLGIATDEYQTARLKLEDAEKKSKETTEEYYRVLEAHTKTGVNGDKITDVDDPEVKAARDAMLASITDLTEAQNNTTTAMNRVQEASNNAADNLSNLVSGLQGLGSGSMSGILGGANSITKIFGENDFSKKMATELGKKLGGSIGTALAGPVGGQIIESAFSLLDLFRDGIENLFSSLIDTVLGSINGLLKSFMSLDIPIEIGKSIRDGLENIANTIVKGLSLGMVSGINWNGSNWKTVADTTQRLTSRNEILCQSIDALKDEMSKARGIGTVQTYKEAYNAQSELIKNTSRVLEAQMGYHGAHHSNSYYIDMALSNADYKKIASAIGREINSAEQIWRLAPEELKKLQTLPDIWDKIYNGGQYDKREYIDQYLELADSLDELTTQLNETLTQISFDSMYDGFIDTLMDMEADSKAFADDVSKYFMKAMLSNEIGSLYSDRLKTWYDNFAKSMKDGMLSEDERKSLNDEYLAIVDEAITLRNQIAAATGYDKTTSSYQQNATQGYLTQLSEDTGSEISGRLAAIQDVIYRIEALDQIENNNASIWEVSNTYLKEIAQSGVGLYDVASDTCRILAECHIALSEIDKTTKVMSNSMLNVEEDMKKLCKMVDRL